MLINRFISVNTITNSAINMEKFDVIIIGGGVSGMFACCSEHNNFKTLVIDKNKAVLKKFMITGKGKSNIK